MKFQKVSKSFQSKDKVNVPIIGHEPISEHLHKNLLLSFCVINLFTLIIYRPKVDCVLAGNFNLSLSYQDTEC